MNALFLRNDIWFIEIFAASPIGQEQTGEIAAKDLLMALNGWLGRRTHQTLCIVNSRGEFGPRHTVIVTDCDCSTVRDLSGLYRVIKPWIGASLQVAAPAVPHQAGIAFCPCQRSNRRVSVTTAPGHRVLCATDIETGFSLTSDGENADSAILIKWLQSRSYKPLEQYPQRMLARTYPQFYCEFEGQVKSWEWFASFWERLST